MGIPNFANMIYRMEFRCKIVFSVTYIERCILRVLCAFAYCASSVHFCIFECRSIKVRNNM